jgi:hypothetical protein
MPASFDLRFVVTVLAFLLTSHVVGADTARPIALDFHASAKVNGCPSAERFGDEVAARLGFVPWDAQAPTALRVRITQDGDEYVGTIEQPDGSSKVLRAASCAKLDEALSTAIAVMLDRNAPSAPATPGPAPDERRLQLDRGDDPHGLVTIRLRAPNGRKLEISRVIDRAMLVGGSAAAAVSYETVCRAPCTAKVPTGSHTWLVRDLESRAMVSEDATVNTSSTVDIEYVSNAAIRKTSAHRRGWSVLIGGALGTVATAYYIESTGANRAYHTLDPLGFSAGMILGAIAGYLISPNPIADTATITVRPGLVDGVGTR